MIYVFDFQLTLVVDWLFLYDLYEKPRKTKFDKKENRNIKKWYEIFTWTILLSDNGLDDETPESDAHDLTEADRTIFGTVSSGDGDVDEVVVIVEVVSEGHDKAVANK